MAIRLSGGSGVLPDNKSNCPSAVDIAFNPARVKCIVSKPLTPRLIFFARPLSSSPYIAIFFLSCWCEFVDRSVGYIRIVFGADDCPDIKNNKLMIKSIRFIILGHLMFVRQKCLIIRILLIVKPKNNIQKTHYFSSLIFTFLNQTSSP